jgi:hypothetical protein
VKATTCTGREEIGKVLGNNGVYASDKGGKRRGEEVRNERSPEGRRSFREERSERRRKIWRRSTE